MLTTWKDSGTIKIMKQANKLYYSFIERWLTTMEQYKGITAKWEFSKKEKAFIDYCIKHNYEITECKQYQSKTKWKFKINNSIVDTWETMNDGFELDEKQLNRSIELTLKIKEIEANCVKGG